MKYIVRICALVFLFLSGWSRADHIIVTGGSALRHWENLRVVEDQHDRWWANFIRASTLRIDEIRKQLGPSVPIVWFVYQPSYQSRGREDGKPYTKWITELAVKRKVTLVWFDSSGKFIQMINARPRASIESLDYFGHSNRYAFLFDYGNRIIAVSTDWLHERDLPRVKSSVFSRNAVCKSWGCHTGESMSAVWKRALGVPLLGACGATSYTNVGHGRLPETRAKWVQ